MSDFPILIDNKDELSPLESTAISNGNQFFDNYLALRANGIEAERAWYGAWWYMFEPDRKPPTKREVAAFLGKSERTLLKWEGQSWFVEMIERRRDAKFLEAVPKIDRNTIEAAQIEKGMIGVHARRLYYDVMEKREQRKSAPDLERERLNKWLDELREAA